MKSAIPYFPAIIATPSVESFAETTTFNNKYFPENKLDLYFGFSDSRRKYLSFKKAFSYERLITPNSPEEHVSVTFYSESHNESNML